MTARSGAVERFAHPPSRPAAAPFVDAAPRRLVVTTLAEYQTDFWIPVGRALAESGHEPAFLAFDDRSAAAIDSAGLSVSNAMDRLRAAEAAPAPSLESLAERFDAFGIEQQSLMISHERFAFELRDTAAMARRLEAYLEACGLALDRMIERGERPVLVQEFGGFLSVVAAFQAARLRGLDNWFLEPSFFRGRLCFTRNGFGTPAIAPPSRSLAPEVAAYLDETLDRQAIAVHAKDRHLLAGPLRRILNARNLRRLIEKSRDKYLLGKRQEFGHIGQHVRRHLRMLRRSARLKAMARPLSEAGRYVYYPLHVPADAALTIRAPAYLDQFAVLDLLCRSVPLGWRVATKEHPAMVGLVDPAEIVRLQDHYDNFVLLPPTTNGFEVIRKAEAVVTVNSKAGAEAMLLGRPTVVLADPFYRDSGLVHPVESLAELPRVLAEALSGPPRANAEAARLFLQRAWDAAYPGELYVGDADNVETVARSIVEALELGPVEARSAARSAAG